MIDIIWLFITTVSILLFVRVVLKVDYASPSFILCGSFVVCSGCSLYVAKAWDIEKVHMATFMLIVSAILIFIIIEEFFTLSANTFKHKRFDTLHIQEKSLSISKSVLYFSIIIGIACTLYSLLTILKYSSAGNWNAIMALYKNIVNTNIQALGVGQTILNQFNKILYVINYLLLVVYMHNSANGSIDKRTKHLYIISFGTYCLFRLLSTGGRQTVLFFICAWLTAYIICKTTNVTRKEKKRENRKYITKFAIIAGVILVSFYFVGRFVGRKESSVFDASFGYLTTGIYGLEWEVRNHFSSTYWGEISFPALYPLFKSLGIMPPNIEPQAFLPFFYHGNTVSLFGRWYWDFGFIGVYVMVVLVSALFSYLYYFKIRNPSSFHSRNRALIVYCMLIHILYFSGYDDFFMNIPSLNYLLIFIILYFFYEWIVKKKIRLIIRRN